MKISPHRYEAHAFVQKQRCISPYPYRESQNPCKASGAGSGPVVLVLILSLVMAQYLQAMSMRDLARTLAKPTHGSPTNPNESGTPASRLIVITP